MTPIEVKELLRTAVSKKDPLLAWPAILQIVSQDMYINVPKPIGTQQGKFTIARWGNRPCKCGCGEVINPGTKVWWEPNWGISFPEHVGKESNE